MSSDSGARTLRRLWSLRSDVGIEADGEGILLVAPCAELRLGPDAAGVEQELRRLALGPVDLGNLDPASRGTLAQILERHDGVVVHSIELAARSRSRLSVVPIATSAPFRPQPAGSYDVVRLSRLANVRPWAGRLVVSAPGARHEVECEGPDLGALLARLSTARQVSDLSGRSLAEDIEGVPCIEGLTAADVEEVIGWLIAARVVSVRDADGHHPEDVDRDLAGWSAHELEFDSRTRRPGQTVEERFRLRDGDLRVADVVRAPFPGRRIPLSGGTDEVGAVSAVLRQGYDAPTFSGRVLSIAALDEVLTRGARVLSRHEAHGMAATQRPYLGMAWIYGLEVYLALDHAELPRDVYHYSPLDHCLVAMHVPGEVVTGVVDACRGQLCARPQGPAGVVMITSRRARSEWALGSLAHATALAESGALTQVLNLVGREVGLNVHPVPLGAAEGWTPVLDSLWPAETAVGVCAVDTA